MCQLQIFIKVGNCIDVTNARSRWYVIGREPSNGPLITKLKLKFITTLVSLFTSSPGGMSNSIMYAYTSIPGPLESEGLNSVSPMLLVSDVKNWYVVDQPPTLDDSVICFPKQSICLQAPTTLHAARKPKYNPKKFFSK